jgi:hypothetical protein
MTTTHPPRPLNPRHGIHEPTSGTPARTPGSVRRTATVDMLRPDGLDGPLVLMGRGRDLSTGRTPADVLAAAEASCRAVVDFAGGRTLREIATTPERPGLERLRGSRVSSGFRGRLDEIDPNLHAEHDLLYLLLDDLPVTTLVSGHAFMAGHDQSRAPDPMAGRPAFAADLCAGFATGATIMNEIERTGSPPVVTGPAAPALADQDDPMAWHDIGPLPPHSMRRTRRIDVRPGEPATVDAIFRDSYVRPDGLETIIHEYTLTAEIDDGTVRACEATARVLPWTECPAAVASAGRLAGIPLRGLRRHVRKTFTGTSTCTHLNDMLRALEDVAALLELATPLP